VRSASFSLASEDVEPDRFTLLSRSYFDNIKDISRPDYMPSDQDILRSRVKSTGITETTFKIKVGIGLPLQSGVQVVRVGR
jgi:hypothetical protein